LPAGVETGTVNTMLNAPMGGRSTLWWREVASQRRAWKPTHPQLPRNVSLRLRTAFSGKFLANGGPEPLGRETGRVDHPPWPAGSAWSPPPESNRRPHPYHGSAAERRASRRLRSSQRTVDAAVMGSVPAPASRPPRPSSVALPAPRRRRVLPWGNLLRVLPRPLAAPRARRGSVPASAPPGSAPRWATRRRTGRQGAFH